MINNTPSNPINIDVSFKKENLSSFVIKWDKMRANIGATDKSNPAVLDWIYISDQLINEKGMKFPIKPIKKIWTNISGDKLNLRFLNLK